MAKWKSTKNNPPKERGQYLVSNYKHVWMAWWHGTRFYPNGQVWRELNVKVPKAPKS